MEENTKLFVHFQNNDKSHSYTESEVKIRENLIKLKGETVHGFIKALERDKFLFTFFIVGRFICYLEINAEAAKMHFFDTGNDDIKAMELYANCGVTSKTFEKQFMNFYHETKDKNNFDDIELIMNISNLN